MPIDFGKLTDKIVKRVLDNLENSNSDVQNAGEQIGENFVNGIEQGLEDAASRITASSFKITKAFRDLAKKITSQSISLDGLSIDFSDIDINEADFQKKINEVFEKFKIDNAIEFDSAATEKQFKNMLALHTKYAVKLSKLQEQRPKLTSQASIKANAQAQLAVIDGLKEIQKILDQTSGMSIELPHVYFGDVKELRTSISLIEQMEKGEAKVAKQHDTNADKIRKENKELKERNKLLEEKVGPLEEGAQAPVKKKRGRKPKVAAATSSETGGVTLVDQNKKLEERNRLIDQYIEALKKARAIEAKYGPRFKDEVTMEDYNEWSAAMMVGSEMSMHPDYDDIRKGVAEKLGAEMNAFTKEYDALAKEFGYSDQLFIRFNNLLVQVQQGALNAAEAVAKLREEMAAQPPVPKASSTIPSTDEILADFKDAFDASEADYMGDIKAENGDLEDRLELLKDIAEQYGVDGLNKDAKSYHKLWLKEMEGEEFSDSQNERYSETFDNLKNAASYLLDFEKTYDRIIVKFANGKDLEILPNAKGLADLAKINDEYGESYNGKEIADVIFVRTQASAEAAAKAEAEAAAADKARFEEARKAEEARRAAAEKASREREKQTRTVVQLVDNYGDSLDEVNNKLMQGTKFLDEQGRIIRLFHNSDEAFDKFDTSKSGGRQGVGTLGKGNYLHFGNGGKFDDPKYGRYQTQWYANINKVFDAENDELSSEQIKDVIDKFLPGLTDNEKKNYINKFGKKYMAQAVRYVAQKANAEVADVWKYLGYDAVRRGDEINIFDSSKIHRANDSVLDMAQNNKNKFARTINGKSGRFTAKKPAPTTYETDSGQMSILPVVEEEVDAKNKLAEANVKVASSQKKVNEAAQGVQMSIDDIVPASAAETAPKVEEEAKALDKVGAAAEKAAKSKKKFAGANKEVTNSTGPSVKGLKAEADAAEEVAWSMTRLGTKSIPLGGNTDAMDDFNLPHAYMGEKGQDAVQMFAGLKSEIEEMTGKPVIIDFVSKVNDDGQLAAVGATLKYVNEEAGVTVKQFYKIEERENGILVATQSQEKATLAASKAAKVFNTEMQQKLALEQIKTLEGQMGSLELDLTEVKNAAKAINDKASLENFNLALRAAKEQAKQLKTELKGQNTLDTIASMERALLTLPSRLEEIQRRLTALGDIDGVDEIDDVLRSINDEYQRFLRSDDSEEKVKLFRNLTSSMVWANAEMRNLSGKNAENKKQQIAAKSAEDAQKKAARESYASWWKAAIDEQAAGENEAKARQKQEQAYSDWWQKALFDREQQEKAKDERVIAARKKKEEAYEAWWQKALYNKEKAPNLKYGKTTANSARRKLDATEGAVDAIGVTNPKVLAKLETYRDKVKEVEDLREKFASDASAADDAGLVKQFQKASYEAEQLRRGIKAITDEEQKMMQLSDEQGFTPIDLTPDQIANLKNEMIAHAQATAQGKVEIKGWNDDQTKMYYTVTDSKGAVHEMTEALGEGTNRLYQYRTATKETGTLVQQIFKGIKVKAKELLSFVIGGGSVYKAIAMLRQGIQYVREIDLALTELKKVTNETEETYDKFLDTASKTAAKVGSTIKDVISSTADWARLNI